MRTSCGCDIHPGGLSRRDMLRRAGLGVGSLALAAMMSEQKLLGAEPDGPLLGTHIVPRAKRVIVLFMGGGPSQVDTFDPKPELTKLNGQNVPESIAKGITQTHRVHLNNLFASPWKFKQYGQSGLPVSELFPEIGKRVDDLCILRSMRHPSPVHSPAEYIALTGSQGGERPSLGAWVTYGLGSENQNLPAFVAMLSGTDPGEPSKTPGWSNGFLPARYQATRFKDGGIPNLAMPSEYTMEDRRQEMQLIEEFNRRHMEEHLEETELDARIRSYEMAYRMQSAAPEVFDLSGETPATRKLYGLDEKETAEFGKDCLLARRLVERGVRFVQLRLAFWDAHAKIVENHTQLARKSDRPIAALLIDLKQRGLLDDTLVVWGGEFGRTPAAEATGKDTGRDHNCSGYTMWLAGGGIKGGQAIGATDAVGYAAIERPIHPNDLHATLLYALGIDQNRLWFEHHNRHEKVTVNGGEVIREVFA
ncbi:MAG: hypothetical protein JWN24_1641 [Phycisphaerales bacterium]|nr:hypothetical protein [Phycisphaerales bacterium]